MERGKRKKEKYEESVNRKEPWVGGTQGKWDVGLGIIELEKS